MVLSVIRLAIAGDLHGSWLPEDKSLLEKLNPDGVLFVGDLSDGDLRIVKAIKDLPFPKAVILGNHDRGHDHSGETLRLQLNLLAELHCGWGYRKWSSPELSIVGARPCSAGGGFYLSPAVEAVFGQISLEESVDRIVLAAKRAPRNLPLVILAHAGPTGLGSDSHSLCGRDWKSPAVDWGDKDLELALDQIRKVRIPDLVVFGHMHHALKRGKGSRCTFAEDRWGTAYLNAACVPRRGIDDSGNLLCHFSWVEFNNSNLQSVSHRWFKIDSTIAFEETLLDRSSSQ